MTKLDLNRLAMIALLFALVLIAAVSDYRLEIGATGLKFERTQPLPALQEF